MGAPRAWEKPRNHPVLGCLLGSCENIKKMQIKMQQLLSWVQRWPLAWYAHVLARETREWCYSEKGSSQI